jgi:hypothetical protein
MKFPWTEDRVKHLLELKAKGLTHAVIGKRFGLSETSIGMKLKSLGMTRSMDPFVWSDEAMEQLAVLWAGPLSTKEIGEVLGRSKNAVISRANRMGLYRRGGPAKVRANPRGKQIGERADTRNYYAPVNPIAPGVLEREDRMTRQGLVEANAAHLDDLDDGGYPDASATELLEATDRYRPVPRQVLWASLAVRP